MLFNPHVIDPAADLSRLFQKTSKVIPSKLFGVDYLAGPASDLGGPATITAYSPNYFAHYPSQGFDCIFADGSVQFVQSFLTFNLVSSGTLATAASTQSNVQYDQVYTWLENGN